MGTPSRRTFLVASLAGVLCSPPASAATLVAPNVVRISDRLTTSGQPPVSTLEGLSALGFDAVVSLVPFTVPGSVRDTPALLGRQGIAFVHIPIPFDAPEERHVLAVSDALARLQTQHVLVHCEVNMRASSMVFLHRVLRDGEDPARAYEAVAAVWSPRGPWRRLMEAQLRKHGIAFEPY